MKVGVLGGGQLGRMLGLAGIPLGIECRFLDPSPEAPARAVGPQLTASWLDEAGLDALASDADVVTYEFENVPVEAARRLAARVPVHPRPAALEAAQDRLVEKGFFRRHGVGTTAFAEVSGPGDFEAALEAVKLPAILKTRRAGYDGKGQAAVRTPDQLGPAFALLGERPCILEERVDFRRELSILSVRGVDGSMRFWPLVENHHESGILRRSIAPAPDVGARQAEAEALAGRLLEALDYVGVLAVELFEVDGPLLANEMAPRVHNSGHWTIEGAVTSQFENHLRAVLGWPLGETAARGPSAMINLIGTLPDAEDVLAIPGACLHLYGKRPRPGRKVGHVTVLAPDVETLRERIEAVERVAWG